MQKNILDILEEEKRRHPYMTEEDVFKLFYQAVFGIDHLLVSKNFKLNLSKEWDSLDLLSGLPDRRKIQIIDPEGKTARIHLFPCKADGINLNSLEECLFTQPLKKGKAEKFNFLWSTVLSLADSNLIDFSGRILKVKTIRDTILHHSNLYGPAYYRILNDITHPETANHLKNMGIS